MNVKLKGDTPPADKGGEIKSALEVAMERIARMEADGGAAEEPEQSAPARASEAGSEALTRAQQQAQEYLTALQYKSAEFDNFRKRMRRELEERARRSIDVAELLPLMDDFDRAAAAAAAGGPMDAFMAALSMLHSHLEGLLKSRGVERRSVVGEPFDPRFHEAVMVEEHPDAPDGAICRELEPLYTLDGETLRPARVVVSQRREGGESGT